MPHIPVTHSAELHTVYALLVWLQHALHGELAAFFVLAFLHPCMFISHML